MNPLQELEGLDPAHQLALVKKIGGREQVWAILRDEMEIVVQPKIKTLFDKHGRCIPKELPAHVRDPIPSSRLNQLTLSGKASYEARILRLHNALGIDTKITAKEFKKETERLLELIRTDVRISNITNGVYFPVICPKLDRHNFGAELERYIAAISKSYLATFPHRTFLVHNLLRSTYREETHFLRGMRTEKLTERLDSAPVIGLCFPQALHGFSVSADREQIASLPEKFILSGIDTMIAMIMYPDVLVPYDLFSAEFDLASLFWQWTEKTLYFGGLGNCLGLIGTGDIYEAHPTSSGGLLFIG